MAECTSCSGNDGATQAGASSNGIDGPSASEIASNLADASTGPAGLEVDRFAAHVDAAMDAVRAGLHQNVSAADIEAAAMARLGPREAAQFQQALGGYRSSPAITPSQSIAMNAPFSPAYTDRYNAVGLNDQGHAINSCGEVINDLPAQTYFEAGPTPYQQAQAQQRADAMRNIELITSGPFSGLFAAGGVIFGAEQRTIEGLAQVGQMIDGFTEPLGPSAIDAMRP
ncbi:MAG: hypothetical protein SXU28_11535 [Pseudomonadota bacterium]|nr:hypothetical protein [Pseudomonadota bacterium]